MINLYYLVILCRILMNRRRTRPQQRHYRHHHIRPPRLPIDPRGLPVFPKKASQCSSSGCMTTEKSNIPIESEKVSASMCIVSIVLLAY